MYHVPVLLKDCIEGLNIQPDGTYVDVTFGGGGHSREILKHLNNGRLVVFDQDNDALSNKPDDPRLIFIHANFRLLKEELEKLNITTIDGLLADLGVSSHQFDIAERGFSIRFDDAPLDMRMGQQTQLTAEEVINTYDEKELIRLFRSYGEIDNVRKMVDALIKERKKGTISTSGHLKKLLKPCIRPGKENQYYAQVYQALRIEVNKELEVLEALLEQSAEVLKPGGRLVVISYHSLEDRLVKNYMRSGYFDGTVEKDFYGNTIKPFEALTGKPVIPDDTEIAANNRARSAKLRIAAKTA